MTFAEVHKSARAPAEKPLRFDIITAACPPVPHNIITV